MLGLLAVLRLLRRAVGRMARDPETRGLLSLTLVVIGAGTWFYHRIEHLSWVDSVYFTVVTLTTVGYGDIAPQTSAGKIFTVVYLLIGVGILVAFLTTAARHIIAYREEKGRG